ncbi:HNH endonuclease [Vibrio cholerae]|nr:HNH endonuclease [Vibrio cholerae]
MKLNTLIHRQGGFCFYCRKPLLERDASIEHIIPSSMGGLPRIYQPSCMLHTHE